MYNIQNFKSFKVYYSCGYIRSNLLSSISSKEPSATNPGAAGSNLHEPRRPLHGSNCVCLE